MKPQLRICDGNDKTMLDESLASHIFHCPKCDVHLTSLGLCPTCGWRYEIPTCLYTVDFNPDAVICGSTVIGYYRSVPLCRKHIAMVSQSWVKDSRDE